MKYVVAIPKSVLLVVTILTLALFTSIYPIIQWKPVFASPDTITLRPNSVGSYQEWETLVGSTHWGATSDESDTTYIKTTGTSTKIDMQNLADPTFGDSDIVNSVNVFIRATATGLADGFVWLDSPDEIDLGSTVNAWVENQDLSDDSVPSSATGVILAWVQDSTTTNLAACARGSEDTNNYMSSTSYCELEEECWRMQIVKLGSNKYIDTYRENTVVRCYVMGYTVGTDPLYATVPATVGALTADSAWHSITVSGVDEDTTGIILFAHVTSSTDTTLLTRAVGSTDAMTAREYEEYGCGLQLVKIDASDQFQYYLTSADTGNLYVIGQIKISMDWLDTNRDAISATATGWTVRDLDSYITVPSGASGVILQHESTGSFSDYMNIAREYGTSWTFPRYDLGGDQWLEGGCGIDADNQMEIYCENIEQDCYIHAITRYIETEEKLYIYEKLNTNTRTTSKTITRDTWNEYSTGALTTAPDGLSWTKQKVIDLQAGVQVQTLGASETLSCSEIWIVVDYTPTAVGYSLNLRIKDYDLTDNIANTQVCMNNGTDYWQTSDANGWANYTGVSGTVTVKVQYFGFWVNGTFSVTMDSDKTIDVQCKLYDVTVLVQESVQNAYLASANVTVYNSTSVQGNKITSGVTGNNGQVQLLNLPNNTLTFTQYGGASYSLLIGNTTQPVSSENQTITLTADQNNVNTNNNYSIIAFAGMTIPLKGSFAAGRLKKKRRNK
jgi:hypothetical protein